MLKMFKGMIPGTFDPLTFGHLNLISRAAKLCDVLVVGIGVNLSKKAQIFTVDERIEILKKETSSLSNVEVTSFSGLVINFAKTNSVHTLIRGMRCASDLEYEAQMAFVNRSYNLETMFLMAEDPNTMISSSLIRELAYHKAPLKQFVPSYLESILHSRLQES